MSGSPSSSSSSSAWIASSSTTGPSVDPLSDDSSDYPTIFLLAIFLPSTFVGLVIAYLHYSMRTHGELRWPAAWKAAGRRGAVQQQQQQQQQHQASATDAGVVGQHAAAEVSGVEKAKALGSDSGVHEPLLF